MLDEKKAFFQGRLIREEEEEKQRMESNRLSFGYQYNRISNNDQGSAKIIRQSYLVSFYLRLYLNLNWYWTDRI